MNYLYFGALGGSFEQAKSRMEKECGVSIEKSSDIHLFLNEGKTFGVDLAERVGYSGRREALYPDFRLCKMHRRLPEHAA